MLSWECGVWGTNRTLRKVSREEAKRFRGLRKSKGLGGTGLCRREWEALREGGAKRGPRDGETARSRSGKKMALRGQPAEEAGRVSWRM